MTKRPVLVTTEFRGVFFGYAEPFDELPRTITLTDARNCIYWPRVVGGFLGLATVGPIGESSIGPTVSELELYGVTSIGSVSPEAERQWREVKTWS